MFSAIEVHAETVTQCTAKCNVSNDSCNKCCYVRNNDAVNACLVETVEQFGVCSDKAKTPATDKACQVAYHKSYEACFDPDNELDLTPFKCPPPRKSSSKAK